MTAVRLSHGGCSRRSHTTVNSNDTLHAVPTGHQLTCALTKVAWREDRFRFWQAIARGVSSEDSAMKIGVSQAVGTRWFRHAGGVGRCLAPSVSGRYLSFAEREETAL